MGRRSDNSIWVMGMTIKNGHRPENKKRVIGLTIDIRKWVEGLTIKVGAWF